MRILMPLSVLMFIMYVVPCYCYENISPYNVDYAVIKVIQKIKFEAKNTKEIEVFSYIPQEDFFQKIISIEADQNFTIVKDEFGNKMLKFTPEKNEIKITTILEIKRRKSIPNNISFPFKSDFTFLNSSFPLVFGYGNDFQKFGKIAQWIYANIEYDERYGDKILSAQQVFEKRKGVCDEFSTLFIAFLRKLGYQASYEIGYAFDKKDFRAHSWVRIYGKNITDIDPTWCQMPVDALHIKFASLPHAMFNETKIIAKGNNPEVIIYPQEIKFEIIEYKESPLVNISFEFVEKQVSSNSYVLGKIKVFSDECIITKLNLGECVDKNGNAVVKPYIYPKCIYFCGNAKYFSAFYVSKIDYAAKCNISALVNFGMETYDELEIKGENNKKVWLSVEKNKVKKGEKVKVFSNGHIFTLDGDYAFKQGEFKINENKTIYAIHGTIEKKEIAVAEYIPFEADIKNISFENNTAVILIQIKNLLRKRINILIESDREKILATLLPNESKLINISCSFFTPAQIKISYKDFSITLSKYIEKKEKYSKDIFEVFKRVIMQIIEFVFSLI